MMTAQTAEIDIKSEFPQTKPEQECLESTSKFVINN